MYMEKSKNDFTLHLWWLFFREIVMSVIYVHHSRNDEQ